MINDSGIALDNALDCEIASIPSIGNFFVFEDFDGCFDCINRSTTSTKKAHGNHAGTESLLARSGGDISLHMFVAERAVNVCGNGETHSAHALRWICSFVVL